MSGEVIRNRWWKGVPRTITAVPREEPEIIVKRPSLDALADRIRRESNGVVLCQCELAKAEQRLEEAKQAFAEMVIEIDRELQALRGRV